MVGWVLADEAQSSPQFPILSKVGHKVTEQKHFRFCVTYYALVHLPLLL